MSTQSPRTAEQVAKGAKPAVKKDTQGPPDERFWVRYSPHHEAPLSGVGSMLLHVLAIVAIVLITLGFARLDKGKRQLPITAGVRAGGGGGPGNAVGPGSGGQNFEDPGAQPMPMDTTLPEPKAAEQIKTAATNDPVAPENVRPISTAKAKDALAMLNESVRSKLNQNLGNPPGGGVGPGSDGGKDGKKGSGEGPGSGSGSGGKITQREERMLRWTMTFSTRNGNDYVQQLRALGALLAIPVPGTNPPQYQLIRDLSARPPRLLDEDLSQIKRIYWVDNKPDSVRSLMSALGLSAQVDHFVAFMPPELEQKLLRLERGYRNRQEHQIEETLFGIKSTSTGFEPFVVSQTPKR